MHECQVNPLKNQEVRETFAERDCEKYRLMLADKV